MSDSGRTLGDCQHGRSREQCYVCTNDRIAELLQENIGLKLQLASDAPWKRVEGLENAIRQHRDERGDDRCHADDGKLYAVLPEGDTRPERETLVTIENCARYIACRQTGREYVSPQRRIEELEQEVLRLRNELLSKLYSLPLTLLDPDAQLLREFEDMS